MSWSDIATHSPRPARGERPTREAWRVRGSLRGLCSGRGPLIPTFSPQAGRRGAACLWRRGAACLWGRGAACLWGRGAACLWGRGVACLRDVSSRGWSLFRSEMVMSWATIAMHSPLPARGERPTREAWRVRGSLRGLCSGREPLIPTFSPQAGRRGAACLWRRDVACLWRRGAAWLRSVSK